MSAPGTTRLEACSGTDRWNLEVEWIQPGQHGPLALFLHEGLGSVSLWRDFPQRLCRALGWAGLVWSRPGYGQSTPPPGSGPWGMGYMHEQAHTVLPALLRAAGLMRPNGTPIRPIILIGHSDGGSIALLYAARHPDCTAGLVVLAPHCFVEARTLAGIQAARQTWESESAAGRAMRAGLARHHAAPDSVFLGWNRSWLDPDFRDWNIEEQVAQVSGPVLAIQGEDDAYGTLEQIHTIARLVPGTQLSVLPHCGHTPHRDQPEAVLGIISDWALATFPSGLGHGGLSPAPV